MKKRGNKLFWWILIIIFFVVLFLFLKFAVFKSTGEYLSVLNMCCQKECVLYWSCQTWDGSYDGSSSCSTKGNRISCSPDCTPSIPAGCDVTGGGCYGNLYSCNSASYDSAA